MKELLTPSVYKRAVIWLLVFVVGFFAIQWGMGGEHQPRGEQHNVRQQSGR